MNSLLKEIRNCSICAKHLPLGPNPVLRASVESKILLVGQAPGTAVHNSGIPWNDPSGKRLRQWLGVSEKQFYNEDIFAIIPMGFCYPGKGKSGDLPPRKECAENWHPRLLEKLQNVELTILIGQYAINYFLKDDKKKNLTETVMNFEEYLPNYIVLPHPSPRNNIWLKRHSWFEQHLIPKVKKRVQKILV